MTKIEIVDKPISGNMYLKYKSFRNIPSDLLITDETPKGTIVFAANFPQTVHMVLKAYHPPTSQSFPSGGYTLWNPKDQSLYSCYLDAAMIHPNNKKKSRKRKKSRSIENFFE